MVVANKNQIMAGKVLAKSFPVIFGAPLNLPIVVVLSYFEQFEVINYWWLAHCGQLQWRKVDRLVYRPGSGLSFD